MQERRSERGKDTDDGRMMTTATTTGTEQRIATKAVPTPDQHEQQLNAQLEELFNRNADEFDQNYEVLSQLGSGAQGKVFHLRERETGKELAAKVLSLGEMHDWDDWKKMERQAEVLNKLDHPGIIHVEDYTVRKTDNGWVEDTEFILLTELVNGRTLREAAKDGINETQLQSIKEQAMEALQYAHSKGIIHRDVKLENILLTDEGAVKVIDFGVAKILGRTTHASTVGVPGTINYMAPELMRGGKATAESDYFALGATLIALTRGEEYTGVRDHHELAAYVDQFTHLSPKMKAQLKALVAEKPEDRLKTPLASYSPRQSNSDKEFDRVKAEATETTIGESWKELSTKLALREYAYEERIVLTHAYGLAVKHGLYDQYMEGARVALEDDKFVSWSADLGWRLSQIELPECEDLEFPYEEIPQNYGPFRSALYSIPVGAAVAYATVALNGAVSPDTGLMSILGAGIGMFVGLAVNLTVGGALDRRKRSKKLTDVQKSCLSSLRQISKESAIDFVDSEIKSFEEGNISIQDLGNRIIPCLYLNNKDVRFKAAATLLRYNAEGRFDSYLEDVAKHDYDKAVATVAQLGRRVTGFDEGIAALLTAAYPSGMYSNNEWGEWALGKMKSIPHIDCLSLLNNRSGNIRLRGAEIVSKWNGNGQYDLILNIVAENDSLQEVREAAATGIRSADHHPEAKLHRAEHALRESVYRAIEPSIKEDIILLKNIENSG